MRQRRRNEGVSYIRIFWTFRASGFNRPLAEGPRYSRRNRSLSDRLVNWGAPLLSKARSSTFPNPASHLQIPPFGVSIHHTAGLFGDSQFTSTFLTHKSR